MQLKQTGSVFINHGLWYYSVQLPGEKRRRQVPLKAPNAKHTMRADRPRQMAEQAAARYWEENTRQVKRHEKRGMSVADLCAAWAKHCAEYYRGADGTPTSTAVNAVIDVRPFRDLFGNASIDELTHTDMLKLRDALVRSGVARTTVNVRLWRIKFMLTWALDEALISAQQKAELTQVRGIKRGRSSAPERAPVRPVDDATIAATLPFMMPNSADMVRVHRLTGMRPCEICAMSWKQIDTSRTPWIYRVPPTANKNAWRGEFGMPRVILIGPKARAILERHRTGDAPFTPQQAMAELFAARRAARKTPFYGKQDPSAHIPRVLSARWNTSAYSRTISYACKHAGVSAWSANQLRHAFGTEVRRAYGLETAKAVLGHTGGGCITDIYTFDAIEEETIQRAAPAVEALG